MRRILLALSLLLAPMVAEAATCTSTGSGTWGPIGSGTATWSCGAGTASDQYTIADTFTVTQIADVAQNTTASIGITVAQGGAFTATVAGATSTAARLNLTLGANGLNCQSGSTCTLTGAYPTLATSPTLSATPTSWWSFGDPVPCPGADCTLMRISYPTATYNAATGTALDTGIDQSIAALAAGDILCFWNPTGAETFGTPDINMCYPIAAVNGGSSPYTIDFKVRVAPNLPVTTKQQDLLTGTLLTAATKGSRTISVPGTVIGTGEESIFVGRWIRMEKASGGTYEPFAYRILRAVD